MNYLSFSGLEISGGLLTLPSYSVDFTEQVLALLVMFSVLYMLTLSLKII